MFSSSSSFQATQLCTTVSYFKLCLAFHVHPQDKATEGKSRISGHTEGELTLSPVMANGALNHCSKVLQLLKIVGRRKLSRAQSSGSLFCRGVPVSKSLRGAT